MPDKTNISNNKRIAKNTLFLYFRMMLTMGVMLYTSRIVLATLGVENYGIYGIVGGVIVMFGFLNSSMAGATSRFLTFELGRSDYEKLKKTFSAALTIHFIIAGIILLLGETIGLWWLENKLVIPIERMNAARWVFHLSILSSMVAITQVPYDAMIIAHERMNVYAYVEILNSLLKLGIVYLLVIGNFDKLILYAILALCVTIIITSIYKLYCTKNFLESHYKFAWNKEIIRPMLSFSGWDLYGNMCVVARSQGINILLNLFFGVLLNAAYSIANQVQGAALAFSNNFLMAVRPQIVKYYASGEVDKMQQLMINAAKFSFLLLLLISSPLIVENRFILHLWLKKVPDHAVVFCQWIILSILFKTMGNLMGFAVHATGKMKLYSFTSGTVLLLTPLTSYCLFKVGFPPVSAFIVDFLLSFVFVINNMFVLHKLIAEFSILQFVYKVIILCIVCTVVSFILPLYFHWKLLNEGWTRFIFVGISSILSVFLSGYFIVLSKDMRKKVMELVLYRLRFGF